MKKLTPRTWYLVGAGLMVSAVAMAGIAFSSMLNRVEGMQRAVMPGTAQLTVPAGTSTLYAESESIVGGTAYKAEGPVQYRCGFEEKDRVTIQQATGQVTYTVGDFAGRNAFDIEAAEAGTYTLRCESENGKPFVLAMGRGVGSAIVVGVVALVPFLLGLALVIAIYAMRRSQRRRMG